MTDQELMKQALDALENAWLDASMGKGDVYRHNQAIAALRERLAHCDRCGKKLGGKGDIHTCTPLIGCVQHDCAKCKARLAQPEQEPVAFCDPTDPCNETAFSWPGTARKHGHTTPLHTSTPQRKPLTDEEIDKIYETKVWDARRSFARAIEAAHGIKEKNT